MANGQAEWFYPSNIFTVVLSLPTVNDVISETDDTIKQESKQY